MNERMLTIVFIGVSAVIAGVGSVLLFLGGHDVAGASVLGLVTTSLGLLAPSPLSKNFVPPDPALDEKGEISADVVILVVVVLIALRVFGVL